MLRIRIWQWPNLLALDAALIALFWQAVFAMSSELQMHPAAQIVLGLSVWLTYMADRLFDVAKRSFQELHSNRHRFAKQNSRKLWILWFCALITNIGIALNGLMIKQLQNGAVLLSLCLLYTLMNQILSRRFFPKEICVAIIYAGGVIVFLLPNAALWAPASALALLCWINCLMIGAKERRIDAALQVRSMALLSPQLIITIELICAIFLYFLELEFALPIGLSLGILLIIQACEKRLSIENFRILVDASLLIGPSAALFINN